MKNKYYFIWLLLSPLGLLAQNTLPTSGNIGINTLNPAMPLDVNGNANVGSTSDRFYFRISSSFYPELRFRTPTDNEVIRLGVVVGQQDFPAADGDFYIYSAATGTMPFVAKKNGNISLVATSGATGIGITDPKYKLNVAQDITMNTDIDVAQFGVSGSSDPAKRVVMGYDVNGAGFGFIKAGWFQHQWTNLALQPNGGNVGIGITNPTEKLAVNGNIRSKEVKVESANWPDYVFKKEYALTPLSEVEKYINTNGHLPEIPSALEVQKNGIALGELNNNLVKKIEELTLHLIEQNKSISIQNEKLLEQDKRISLLQTEINTIKKGNK